jgi:hypothetical protein
MHGQKLQSTLPLLPLRFNHFACLLHMEEQMRAQPRLPRYLLCTHQPNFDT